MQLEIIRATEFVRVGPKGHFDLPRSKEVLRTLARACRKRGIQHAIIDLRDLQPGPTPVFSQKDLMELVTAFPDVGFSPEQLRLAVLYRSDPHKRTRLFALLSILHGWDVRAFATFEGALLWLSERQAAGSGEHRATGAQRVPVRFAGRSEPAPAETTRRRHRAEAHPAPRKASESGASHRPQQAQHAAR